VEVRGEGIFLKQKALDKIHRKFYYYSGKWTAQTKFCRSPDEIGKAVSKGGRAMPADLYKKLAQRLDAIPNGFPATEGGVELKILAR
jgi:hypothetical protein